MGKVSIDQALDRARLLRERGDHAQACKIYGKILRVAPKNTDAKAGLAALISTPNQPNPSTPSRTASLPTLPELTKLLENRQFGEVVHRASSLTETYASVAAFWNLYGIALRETGQLNASLSAFRKAGTLDPGNEKISYNLALLHQKRQEHETARCLFQKLVETNPDWVKPRIRLGEILKNKGEIQDALPHYQRASELAPDDPKIQNAYGLVLSLDNRPEEAIPYFQKATELKNDYAKAHFNFGNTLKKNDKILEALEEYRKAVKIDPEFSEAWQNLGNTLILEEDYDEGIACYDKLLTLQPDDTDVMLARGRSLISAGYIDEAQDYFLRLIPVFPQISEFHYYTGRTYISQGDLENSIAYLSAAYHLNPHNIGVFATLASMPQGTLPDDIVTALKMNCEDVSSTLPRESRHFIKAHVLRHLGQYEKSWQHYVDANATVFSQTRSLVRKSIVEQNQMLAKVRTQGPPKPVHDDDNPISLFIVGPSRSGKTRLERLLATSRHVKRGYENPSFSIIAKKICSSHGLGAINRLGPLGEAGKTEFCEKYKARLRVICKPRCVFTDTSPYRIFNAWEIADKIPNAFFIFVQRDPLDTAADIFKKDYRSGNYYAYHPMTIHDHVTWYYEVQNILVERLGRRAVIIDHDEFQTNPTKGLTRIEAMLGGTLGCAIPPSPPERGTKEARVFRSYFEAMLRTP